MDPLCETPSVPQRSGPKPNEEAAAGSGLLACRACLAVDGWLRPMSGSGFEDILAEFTGLPLSMEGFPRHLCAYCRARLSKCAAFRDSCRRSTALLRTLLERGPLTSNDIKAIDRDSHKLTNGLTHERVFHYPTHQYLQIAPIKIEVGEIPLEYHENQGYTEIEYLETDSINCNQDVHINCADEKEMKVKIQKEESEDDNYADFSKNGARVNAKQEHTNLSFVNTIDINIEFKEKPKSHLVKVKKEISTKTTKSKTGNPESREKNFKRTLKRKKIGDEFYPNFNYKSFEKDYNVKIKILTKEEQTQEIEENKRTNKTKWKYCCEICGKGFRVEKSMRNHFFCHDPRAGPIECEICRCRFRATSKSWRRHRDQHKIMLTCQACGRVTRDRSNAKLHSLVHSGKTYACQHCDQVYNYRSSYQNHMRDQHPDHNIACNECGEIFRSEKGVQLHKGIAHRPERQTKSELKCSVCDVTFSSAEALDKHTQSSVGASHAALFPCGACGESCGSDAARAAHVAEKHPAEQLHCDECGVTFSSAASFAVHARRKHPGAAGHAERRRRGAGPAPRPICEVCGRSVQSEAHLRLHMYTHMDQKPFACPVCPKAFAAKISRELHLRTHTGERPFQCAHCQLAFSAKGNLVRHMKHAHLKTTRRYPCQLCDKSYTTPSDVRTHVRAVHHNMPAPKRVRRPKKAAENYMQMEMQYPP